MKTLPLRGSSGVLTSGGVASPGCRSRQSSTRRTPTLSRAHPVTAMDPDKTVELPSGVSNRPKGGEGREAADSTVRVAPIGPAVFAAPVNVSVTLAVCEIASAGTNCVAIDSVAGPLPDVGDTTSQGALEAAVQVTVPGPL